MKLTHLRTNHFEVPLGMQMERPVFSWVAEETKDKWQQAARIAVKTSAGEDLYDSGVRSDISSLGFEVPIELSPRTRYEWSVTVWGDQGDTATASSWFETAKENEPWQAKWIAADFEDKETHPLLSKDFLIEDEIESARIYASGLGIYELEINGEKANDEYLLPGYHSYDVQIEYQTFDVTNLLKKGKNALGFALGAGWYKGDIIFDRIHNLYGDTMQAICELYIKKKDGSTQVVVSDESWKSYPSPVSSSSIYDGEHFDARNSVHGWSMPDCSAKAYGVVIQENAAALVARIGPKIVKKEEFSPVVLHTKRDETVLDFGQNMTGWVEFTVNEPAGTQVKLSYGETLQDDCFYRDNLRTAKSEYLYISDGTPQRVRPHFAFYGFRYVKVEGISEINREHFTACHIRSDIDPIGHIETDDDRVNRLFLNSIWGQFDNFLDVPTDCPQRDERLGWTGDAAIIAPTACKNIYMPAFFHHFVKNIEIEQKHYNGVVPMFIPTPHTDRVGWSDWNQVGCAIWGDVATIMPWTVYENYGDIYQLRAEYPVMKAWVERVRSYDRLDGDKGLWLQGLQLGDWLALDKEGVDHAEDPNGGTDVHYISSCFYYYSVSLIAKAAKALGLQQEEADYTALCCKIRNAILKQFFKEDGSFKIEGTQTACTLSLFLGIYPDGGKEVVTEQLKKRIRAKNMHLDTGFCGSPFLCRALSENGANDYAYTLLLNDDMPSWLFEVKMGATTTWERWNSMLPDGKISGTGMNSLNHYAYGSIADWMYRNICGMNPSEEAPGYKKAVLCPMPDPRLRSVKMRMESASGRYEIEWKYEGETLHYSITVPFDCEAEFRMPGGTVHHLTAGQYTF